MRYEIGDIVVLRFPFTNPEAAKRRPAAVIGSAAYNSSRPDVILLAITSQIRSPLGFGEALIKDW
jgi:mRNA interferase MazF